MVLLGDIVEMTEQEIKEFKNKIYSAYNEFRKTSNLFALTNFIVWCYEYLESYAATKLATNAKLSLIKNTLKILENGM